MAKERSEKKAVSFNHGQQDTYVVAIGASAGGLEAIHEFFDNVSSGNSCSFIVIQHLSPDYKSLLVELVGKHTHMKVVEAGNDMLIQQDCVYIIPNNKIMTIRYGKLKLADKTITKVPNTAIDIFFQSLAKEKKEKAIAIVLSGTGTDGTKGIQAIKENGGTVIVQDPSSAKFDGMPNSAIASGNADYISEPGLMHIDLSNIIQDGPLKTWEQGKVDEQLLDEIFDLVYKSSGNNFNLYKTPTIIRRIGRRMNERSAPTLEAYVTLLRQDAEEIRILAQDFLIGVTKFFRDQPVFDYLAGTLLPEVIKKKKNGETLKIWVCACSTGQEAYSIAILVYDHLVKENIQLDVKIFATDIDEKSIEIASKNLYPLSSVQDVPPALFKKYFTKSGKFCSVIPQIRKQIVFAKHDVIKSPPFIKNDFISCRNMLIYLNSILQRKVLSTFHFSLLHGGHLLLGTSETAAVLREGITEVDSKSKIYQKTGPINYSSFNTYAGIGGAKESLDKRSHEVADVPVTTVEKYFNNFITEELGYVGVFIDKNYLIKETVGNYRQFLTLPDGKIELNLLKMVPSEVSLVLGTAIRKTWKENQNTHLHRIRIYGNEKELYLNISIKPPDPAGNVEHTMIVLSETTVEAATGKNNWLLTAQPDELQNEYLYELEAELSETRNNLQMVVEEMETTNEELQSSNEELISSNEELQSSNEELQSLNEELHTLNTEYQIKIRELVELNDDLDNYFRSAEIGQLFLDSRLNIRKFNPAAVNMVNLIDADIGRSIEHISNNIKSENFLADIRSVLLTRAVIEKEVLLRNGSRSLMKVMPYLRKDKKTDGVVITFVDISQVTELNNMISGVFNASTNAILAFSAQRNVDNVIVDFRCRAFNDASLTFLHKNAEDLTDAMMAKQIPELVKGNLFGKFVAVVEEGNVFQTELTLGDANWYQMVVVKMGDGFAATLTNITERKAAEQKLRKNYKELITARENLKELNRNLEIKVQERTRKLSESEERFNQVSLATNDTIWDWSLVDNYIWRSENFTAIFGYTLNEETSNIGFWFSKIHPDDRQQVKNSVNDAINNKQDQWSAEYRFQRSDGEYAVILDRGSILFDDLRMPYRIVGSIVDITRLTQAEHKLSSSEKRFRRIFESNVIGLLFSNLTTGKIVEANEAFISMLEYSFEDIGRPDFTWENITPPEYREISRQAIEQIRRQGVCTPFEKQYLKKDGTRVDVLVGSALLDDDNDAEAVTYIIDITEQKEAEQRKNELQQLVQKQQEEFFGIFKNAPALITIRRGPELRFEFVNEAFRSFYGGQNYTGKTNEDVYPDYSNSELSVIDRRVMRTGKDYVGRAFHIQKRDPQTGEIKDCWFDFIFTPVYTNDQVPDGIAFFGFDVTDLILAQKATKELMYKKDEFMSIASHELKTPITSIKGSLQIALRLIQKDSPDLRTLDFVEKANRQVGKLATLVEDLLDITKIQSGKMAFNYTDFNLKDFIRECVDDVQGKDGHHVVMRNMEDQMIRADKLRLEQVVGNLLTNAIKYSPNKPLVEIYTAVQDNSVKITVKDFGIGIPADKQEMIFDRFFRIQESSYVISGLGLGLYISSEIVKRHGGDIGVNSREKEGSEFWFTIPISTEANDKE